MSIIKYHKLVRDLIPDIIESSGKICETEVLADDEYLRMIDAKLDEELAEYHKDQNIEELADLMEVIYAAAIARGYSIEQLEQVRAQKAKKRGAFGKKILLKSVFDPNEVSDLVKLIVQRKGDILSKFDDKMMETYRWLQEELYQRDVSVDQEYRRKFSSYYIMRYVSQEYRDAFFGVFEEIKNKPDISFRDVSYRLYEVDQKHQFSFISKMLHTINPHEPILIVRCVRYCTYIVRIKHLWRAKFARTKLLCRIS